MSEQLSGYNQLNAAEGGSIGCDLDSFAAQLVDNTSSQLHGKIITKIIVQITDFSGSSSGNIQAFIVKGDTGTIQSSSNTVNANTLSNQPNFTSVTFTFTGNTYVMNGSTVDYIAIQFNYGGAGSSMVAVKVTSNGQETNTHAAVYSGSWNNLSNTYDICMNVFEATGSTQPAVGIARSTSGGPLNANQYDTPPLTDYSNNDLYMQVYINSATGVPNHAGTILANNGNKFVGEYVNSSAANLFGKAITRAVFRISRNNTPTGTLFCRIRKADNTNAATLGLNNVAGAGLDVSTLTTTNNPAQTYTFENDNNTYALAVGDRVVLELVGGTSDITTNNVRVYNTHTVSTVSDVHLQLSTAGTTWTNSSSGTNDDIIASMFSGGYIEPPTDPWVTLNGSTTRVAEEVINNNALGLFSKVITQVKVKLRKNGSPVGDIFCRIRDSAKNIVATIDQPKRAEDISTAGSFTEYTFTNLAQIRALQVGDTVSIEYSDASANSINNINVLIHLSDPYAFGQIIAFAGAYATLGNYDLSGRMSIGGGSTDPNARIRVGEKVATTNSLIKFKKVSRVRVRLKRTGGFISMTPGLVSVRIRDSADQVIATLGTIDPLLVDPNTATEYTFTSNPISLHALQVGDIISVEYDQGDDNNYVAVMTTKTIDGFDGVINTHLVKHDGIQYVNNTAIDLVGRMDEGGDVFTPSQEEITIPPPKYTKDLTILAGGNPWTYIDHSTSLDSPQSQYYVNAIITDFRFYRKILTETELENIFINRSDQGDIVFGEVAKIGFFSTNED